MRVLSVLLQTVLLLISAVIFGIVLPGLNRSPFHLVHVIAQDAAGRRQYEFDWLIGVLLVYALLLLAGAAARRIRVSWSGSTIALAITVVVGLLLKFGFKTIPAFGAALLHGTGYLCI